MSGSFFSKSGYDPAIITPTPAPPSPIFVQDNAYDFDTVPLLLGDTKLSYSDGTTTLAADGSYAKVTDGQIITVRSQGFSYKVRASNVTDHHLITDSGIKLDVLPTSAGHFNFAAMNPDSTGVQDCWDKLDALLNRVDTVPAAGWYVSIPAIYFPAGTYYFSKTIELKRCVKLYGPSTLTGSPSATLKWPTDVIGITVNRYNTLNGGKETVATSAADGSVIESLAITSAIATRPEPGYNTTAHGIWLRARAVVRNCFIANWGGNGIHIYAVAGGAPEGEGNANNWQLDTLRIQYCENGVYVDSADVNAGYGFAIDSSVNRRWGIWDSSFLGNTWIACHTADNGRWYNSAGTVNYGTAFCKYAGVNYQANPGATEAQLQSTTPGTNSAIWYPAAGAWPPNWTGSEAVGFFRSGGPYWIDGVNQTSVLLGCYTESGQGVSFIASRSLGIGGFSGGYGPWISGSNGYVGVNALAVQRASTTTSGMTTKTFLGEGDGVFLNMEVAGGATPTNVWRLKQNGDGLKLDNANLAARVPLWITGNNTTNTNQSYKTQLVDFVLGGGSSPNRIVGRSTSTTFPASGTYYQGDMLLVANAAASGKMAIVCTTGGTAGSTAVFKLCGAIDA